MPANCGEGTNFEPNSGVCLPLSDCANRIRPLWSLRFGTMSWNAVPEVISGACYFDVNNTGVVTSETSWLSRRLWHSCSHWE